MAGMRLLGLCAMLLVASVAGQSSTPRISVSHTSLTVEEGFKQEITFRLDEPIICPEQIDQECAVVIEVQNPHPNQVAIDNCIVKWDWRDWHQPRTLVLSAVEDFIDDGTFEGKIITDPAISASEYYSGYDAKDIQIKTRPRRSAQCRGTGDPHYTTFDGYYWHIYYAGRYVLYKTSKRTFEVQVQTRSWPARHCAFAAREENDVVVVWACNGAPVVRRSCGSDECRNSGFPKLSVRGSSRRANYYVEFASGAMVRADTRPYYMNMYLTAPGRDFNDVEGVCGNFDGVRNNDGGRSYRARRASDLYDSQKPSYDLFEWYPSPSPPSPPPRSYQECEYEPKVVRPILNRPDAEDITDFIADANLNDVIENEDVVIGGGTVDENMEPIPRDQAVQRCDEVITTSRVADVCTNNLPGFLFDDFIEDCADDVQETGNFDFIEDALEALERQCAERASRDLNTWEEDQDGNPTEPNKEIQTNICPNQCNNRGTCDEGTCTCNDGFLGFDCSIDTNAVPTVTSLVEPFCDTQGIRKCTTELTVLGDGFWNSDNLKCRFGAQETDAFFKGSMEVACAVPNMIHRGGQEETAVVQVTTDGTTWTESTDFVFTWYDGICQVCNSTFCGPNPDSCTIDGTCYRATSPNPDNICQHCDPTSSTTEWTWTYQNHQECGPSFASRTSTVTIVGEAGDGERVAMVDAANPKVAGDSNNMLKYTLNGGDGYFQIDNQGVITATKDFDVLSATSSFNNLLSISVVDSAGNHATTSVVLDLVAENIDPYFQNSSYPVSVPEDVAVGTVIITVQAEDANEEDSLTYSWFSTEEGYGDYFLIDEKSGEVTVNRELDYEDRTSFQLVVRARDSGGQTHVTTIDVSVEDVPEAPTGLGINATSLPENSPVGTVVGKLSTEDPDDVAGTQTFTYSTTSNDFAINGNLLVSKTDGFDYEGRGTSYAVEVTTTDADGLTYTTTLTVAITDVNEAPYNIRLTIDGQPQGVYKINESAPLDSLVGTIQKDDDDADQNVKCSLASSDNGFFEIAGNNLVLVKRLDYETSTSHAITVVCVDDGAPTLASDPKQFTIDVVDVDDGPEDFKIEGVNVSVPEDLKVGGKVATISAVDRDGGSSSFDFSIVTGKFQVSDSPSCNALQDGAVRCTVDVTLAMPLNYEGNAEEQFTIAANSGGRVGSERMVIPVTNVNEPVSAVQWADGVNSVPEDAEQGALVGTLLVVDPDTDAPGVAYSFELLNYTDVFELEPLTGDNNRRRRRRNSGQANAYAAEVRVKDPSRLDFEDPNANSFDITLRITDNAQSPLSSKVSATIDVVDAPLRLNTMPGSVKVMEDVSVGTELAELMLEGADKAGVPYTLTLTDSSQNAFRLDGNKVVVNKELNFEDVQVHELEVTVDTNESPLPTFAVEVDVQDADDAPVIDIDDTDVEVNDDIREGQTVLTPMVSDEDGTPVSVDLKVASSSQASQAALLDVFGIRPSSKAVHVMKSPSSAGLSTGTYNLQVEATSDSTTVTKGFSVTVYDDCRSNSCAATERCVDDLNSYKCCEGTTCFKNTDTGFATRFATTAATTTTSSTSAAGVGGNPGGPGEPESRKARSSGNQASTGLIVGVVVGACCLIALVAVAVILVQRRRNDPSRLFVSAEDGGKTYMANPGYRAPDEPVYAQADDNNGNVQTAAFVSGVANPLYEWYQPDMTRQECTDALTDSPAGSFIVRDSKATPGWHMLGVRTESAIVHEKIKRGDDGMYELLPASSARQPSFPDIPSLVYHYTEQRDDVPFVLNVSMANPMYGVAEGQASRTYAPGSVIPHDEAAPAVPIKESERGAVEQVAALDEGELYTNTTDAQEALHSSA